MEESTSEPEPVNNTNSGSSPARFCCGFGRRNYGPSDADTSPDADFHADSLMKLTHGVTAYRIVEPRESSRPTDSLPVIVCLHGLQNSSYMWADIADLLSDFEQGPQARVVVFDFYGRGRSPWTGINITLDTLVTQTKELLDHLGLTQDDRAVALIGYDMGGAVAAGFAAKYPNSCTSISLISPLGVKYKPLTKENLLNKKYVGEYMMAKQKKTLPDLQESDFYDKGEDSPHRYLINKQVDMVSWQIKHTPGYLGAILSTYRYFPLRGMEELFTAIGRHPRRVMVIWGDHDTICSYKKCVRLMEESFPRGNIVDVLDCGHNAPFEKFEDVVRELLSFNKEVFDAAV